MPHTLNLHAGNRSDGSPVFEEVPVEPLADDCYRLLQSPGFVLGVAAGDVFELRPEGRIEVIRRGRNLSIQMFVRGDASVWQGEATSVLGAIGGWLDGCSPSQLVFTVPVSAGFPAVESAMAKLVAAFPALEWAYGNVYDPKDGVTPLNWW